MPYRPSRPAVDRVLDKVVIDPQTGCWIYTGLAQTPDGYRQVAVKKPNGKWAPQYCHIVTYEHYVRPLQKGEEVDHLCTHRDCCNPEHLEAVSRHTNWERSNCPSAVNARKTHCIHGHPLSGENLYTYANGYRHCLACGRASYERRKQSKKPPMPVPVLTPAAPAVLPEVA